MRGFALLTGVVALGLGTGTAGAAVIHTIDLVGLSQAAVPQGTGAVDGVTIAYSNVSAYSATDYSGNTSGMVAYADVDHAASIIFTALEDGQEIELLGFEVGHFKAVDSAPLYYYFVIDGVQGDTFTQEDGTVSLTGIVGKAVEFQFKDRSFTASTGTFGDWGIDDIQYSVIPEPAYAGLLLMAGGLVVGRRFTGKRQEAIDS